MGGGARRSSQELEQVCCRLQAAGAKEVQGAAGEGVCAGAAGVRGEGRTGS